MTAEDFISLIPQIFMYIIPGFVIVKIIEIYTPRKKRSQYETVLWSILYSFIVLLVNAFIVWGYSKICQWLIAPDREYEISSNLQLLISLIVSGLIGLTIARVSNSGIGRFFTRLFNSNMEPGEDVWFATLKTKNGAWATVYLKNGLIYTGKLVKYTAEPDEANKLLQLTNFRLMIRTQYPENGSEAKEGFFRFLKKDDKQDFSSTIDDNTANDNARVLLRYDDIISIELVE